MISERHPVETADGWSLDVRRFVDPETLDEDRRPVVTVPGYCMNCFVLNYHPDETPMVEYLVESGLEVWTANLRGQGDSMRRRGSTRYGFSELALTDLPSVFGRVLDRTDCRADRVDVVGCSLGATLAYVYLAHHHDDHRLGALVNIGGPLRWTNVHPVIRAGVQCPSALGAVPVRGTRTMARWVLPIIERFPFLASLYINADIVDLSKADKFVETIDDPNPRLTREMARWIKETDLTVEGLEISNSLYSIEVPIQCIIAMQDGVVTPESALSILDHIGSHETEIVEVGTYETPRAHADLFVSEGVEQLVFEPIRAWLAKVA